MSQVIDVENQNLDEIDDETVVLNVGGKKFEVRPSTLSKYPSTLLGTIFHPSNKHLRKPDKKGEYFFDRNGKIFECILDFYRTGRLVLTQDLPQEMVREELKYFKIDFEDATKPENEDDKIMKLPRDQILSFAQSLIHNTSKYDVKRGLYFLRKLREFDPTNFQIRYSSAFACYRLGYNKEGIDILDEILSTDPHNPQAKSLLTLFTDNRITNVRLGILGGILLAVSVYGIFKIRKWYRLAYSASTITKSLVSKSGVVGNVLRNPELKHNLETIVDSVASTVLKSSHKEVKDTVVPEVFNETLKQTTKELIKPIVKETIILSSDIKPIATEIFKGSLEKTFNN